MIVSFILSFTSAKASTITTKPLKFIKLLNYTDIFTTDHLFWRSVLNSFVYAILKVLVTIVFSFIIALLLNKNGTVLTDRGVRLIIDNIMKKSTINEKVSPHVIRHTFATNLLNEGCDITTVQELLGHKSLRATQVYTHVTNEKLKQVYESSHPRNIKE